MSSPRYRERLSPSLGIYLALALSLPMVSLALAPFGWTFAIITAVMIWSLITALAYLASPVIEVTDQEFLAGKMRIPLSALGSSTIYESEAARIERGPGLSPGAAILLRGDIKDVLKIQVLDEKDPTPYLLVSSRNPRQLALALS